MGISKYDRDDRPSPFGVRWVVDGKRKFKFFKYSRPRDEFYKNLIRKEKKLGNSLLNLSSAEANTIIQCIDMLGNCHEVIIACKEYLQKSKIVQISVEKAVFEYLNEKKMLGRDKNYYRAIKNILDRAAMALPDILKEWNEAVCHRWALVLTVDGFAPVTIKNNVKAVNAFCIWCVAKKYMRDNPFKNAPIPDVVPGEIQYLKIDEVKRLFNAAVKYFPEAVAYLALNTFAGLRSSACARLDIVDINFKEQGILIQAHVAKNKRRVYLDGYEANLWTWLEWSRENALSGFKLTKRQWDSMRGKVAKKAGIKMPKNVLRHSFCTYHVALYGDAGKTATLLTHRGNVSILYEHYKGNAARRSGVEFFEIGPEKPGCVLQVTG